MNTSRYQDLVGRLFEGDLTTEEAGELAAAMNESPPLRQDLRQHLLLWDLWSQDRSPERSAESFLRAWKTRRRAECEGADAFSAAVRAQLEIHQHAGRTEERGGPPERTEREPDNGLAVLSYWRRAWWGAIRRHTAMAWAVAVAAVGLPALIWFVVVPPSAQAVTTLQGEAVCTACRLHESQEHWPALWVISGRTKNTYYLEHNQTAASLYCCDGPVPVVVQGFPRTGKQHLWFNATNVTIIKSEKPQKKQPPQERILFPI